MTYAMPLGLGLSLNRIHFNQVRTRDHWKKATKQEYRGLGAGAPTRPGAPLGDRPRPRPSGQPEPADFVPADPPVSEANAVLEQTGDQTWHFLRRRELPPSLRDDPKARYSPPAQLIETVRTPNRLRLFDPDRKDVYELDLKTGKLSIRSADQTRIEVLRYARGTAGRLATAAEWFCLMPADGGAEQVRHFERAPDSNNPDEWLEIGPDGKTRRTYVAKGLVAADGRRSRRLVLASDGGGEQLVLGERESGEIALGRGRTGASALVLVPGKVVMSCRRSPRQARKILLGATPADSPRVLLANTGGDGWQAIRLSTHEVIGRYKTKARGPHRLVLGDSSSTVEVDFDRGIAEQITRQRDGTERRTRMGAICDYDSFLKLHPHFNDVVATEMISYIRLRAPNSRSGTPATNELHRLTGSEWTCFARKGDYWKELHRLVVRAQTSSRIYLQKARSPVWVCIDLAADTVTVEGDPEPNGPIDQIRSLLGATRINEVAFSQGNVPDGVLRQVGFASWIEVRKGVSGPVNYWDEVGRDDTNIWLFDRLRKLYLNISYHLDRSSRFMEGKIYVNDFKWYDMHASMRVNPDHERTQFIVQPEGRGKASAPYWSRTQRDWTSEGEAVCTIVGAARRDEDWRAVSRITERSVFTSEPVRYADLPEELRAGVQMRDCKQKPPEAAGRARPCACGKEVENPCSCGPLADLPMFRTSVTLPEQTSFVDIFAESETGILVRGAWSRIDPDRPLRVFVEQMTKLTVSVPATGFGCPALLLRTDRMKPDERHNVLPDAPLFKKLQEIPEDELARHASDAVAELPPEQRPQDQAVEGVAAALRQLAQMSLHTYNDTPHGAHHGRAVYAAARESSATRINLKEAGRPTAVIDVAAANEIIGRATFHDIHRPGEDLWSWLGDTFEKAGEIVVTTVESAGTELWTAVEHAAEDAVETFSTVGEDILRGDFSDAFSDLIQGGELVASDLASGVIGAGSELLKGASKMALLALDVAGDVISFVVDNVPFLKQIITFITDRLGAAAGGLLRRLLDQMGWENVITVQREIKKLALSGVDRLAESIREMKSTTVQTFAGLTDDLDKKLLAAMPEGTRPPAPGTPAPHPKHSEAIAWIEWLFSKYYEHIAHPNPVAEAAINVLHPEQRSPIDEIRETFEKEMSRDGGRLWQPFEDSLDQLLSVFDGVADIGEHVLAAIIDIARGFVGVGLDLVLRTVTTLLEFAETAIEKFREVAVLPWNIPVLSDFYRALVDDELSLVSLVATCGAIPVALIRGFEGYTDAPFEVKPQQSPDDDPTSARDYALTYGAMHIILAVTATVGNVLSKAKSKKSGPQPVWNDNPAYGPWSDNPTYTPRSVTQSAQGGTTQGAGALAIAGAVFGGFNLLAGLAAQVTGTPIPFDRTYETPGPDAANDIVEAPSWWSHVVWWSLWVMFAKDATFWGLGLWGTFGKSAKAEAVEGFANRYADVVNFLGGVIMYGEMFVFEGYEDTKRDAVANLFGKHADAEFTRLRNNKQYVAAMRRADLVLADYSREANLPVTHVGYQRSTTEQGAKAWLDDLEGYAEWAKLKEGEPDQVALKHAGNFMDCLPAIGRLGFSDLLERAGPAAVVVGVIGGGAMELSGHLIEGSIVVDRARKGNLY